MQVEPSDGLRIGESRDGAMSDITLLLQQVSAGDKAALDRVVPLVFGELRDLAQKHMRRERPDHTLQPTALVNEAYLRLVGERPISFKDRNHFFAVASKKMREILINHAIARGAVKRGGQQDRVSLDLSCVAGEAPRWSDLDLVALDEALKKLESRADPRSARMAEIVERRFFGGQGIREIADGFNVTPRTVERELKVALMILLAEIRK
jgi:RNA polymerase sigma-70 factor, ECF subfamily